MKRFNLITRPSFSKVRGPAAHAVALLLLTSSLFADDEVARREIDFARGLAADWSFVDLAEGVLGNISSSKLSERTRGELGLVKCEVFAIGAKSERDVKRRGELFDQALAAYELYMDDASLGDAKAAAEASFIKISSDYARVLEDQLEDLVGEEAETARDRQLAVLEAAVALTGDPISGLQGIRKSERTEKEARQLYDLMLARGEMLMAMGRAQGEDGIYSFQQSLSTLEDLVFTAGEDSPFALRSYVSMGDNFSAQGDFRSAADFYQAVVDQAIPRDPEEWERQVDDLEITQPQKEFRWLFVQLATRGLLQSLNNLGETQESMGWAMHIHNTWRSEGFNMEPIGWLSMVEVARTLLDAGGFIGGSLSGGGAKWYASQAEAESAGHSRRNRRAAIGLALTLAQEINEANRGNILQLRAQKLIADIIERPGIKVPAAQLFEAAQGEYYAKEHAKAIRGFKRVLAAVAGQDDATRNEFGPKTLYFLGNCYRRMDRNLEATMVFREASQHWIGDPEFDSKNVNGFLKSVEELQGKQNENDVIKEMLIEAERLVIEVGTDDQDSVLFKQAEKARREARAMQRDKEQGYKAAYEHAIELYRQVSPTSTSGEVAFAKIGTCLLYLRRGDEALRIVETYLTEFVKDPTNALKSNARKARRADARAEASYIRAKVLKGKAKTDADQERFVELFASYDDEFEEQDRLAPTVMFDLMLAHFALGQGDEARVVFERMVEKYPESPRTRQAGARFYKKLQDKAKLSPSLELEAEMAKILEIVNRRPDAEFQNLRNESKHWMSLGNFDKAIPVLERIASKFMDGENDLAIKRYVLPDLGHALLGKQQVAEAKAVLAALVAEGAKPRSSKRTTLNFCRAVNGWVVEDESGNIQLIPGAGETAEEFDQATGFINKIANSVEEKWTCEWYSLKFDLALGFHAWSKIDTRKQEITQQTIKTLETELGSSLLGTADVPGIDAECEGDSERAEALGGGILRRRFLWLRGVAK